MVAVACHDSHVQPLVAAGHVDIGVPRRVREHEGLARVRGCEELDSRAHEASQPRVGVLSQRAEGHLRARMPRARFAGEPIAFAKQGHVGGIEPIRHRGPLRGRQVKPRGPLRRPRGGSSPQRRERGLHGRIVRVDDEGQGISAARAFAPQHLTQDAAPLGYVGLALDGLRAARDERGHRVWAI